MSTVLESASLQSPVLSAEAFERVRELIHRRAGIALNPSKQQMVHSRLSRRLRELRLNSFDRYLDDLQRQGPECDEWQEFVNALTTNLTAFFRESHHFPILSAHLQQCRGRGPLHVWCCAASTGEEPYSLAMTARDALGSAGAETHILATDIDTKVLETAQRGVYPLEAVERLDRRLLQRYFQRGRRDNEGLVRVSPELQSMITFRTLNLLGAQWAVQTRFEAIFCRNVLIYFDKPTQTRVLQRLAEYLQPGGLLFVGHSENFSHMRDLFELQGKTVYRVVRPTARGER
jgi:chemotaxis protein methyltransferase CheR